MRIRCDYCGQYIEDTDLSCPHCGAPNDGLLRSAASVPQTIEELQAFCAAHRLPLEKMRFFLGQDYRKPRAFGIYREPDGICVVYKNKADGSRAIRYRGSDEAYAVNEIYQKLKAEIVNQRNRRANDLAQRSRSAPPARRQKNRGCLTSLMILLVILWLLVILTGVFQGVRGAGRRPNGYYHYQQQYYYSQNDDWYCYDQDQDLWLPTLVDDALAEDPEVYYASDSYSAAYGVDDFSDSAYYTAPSESTWSRSDDWDDSDWDWDDDSNWDDDSDWDWDDDSDWDSDWTDWDSDW